MFRNHAHSPRLVMQCVWVCVHAWVFQFILFFLICSTVVHCLWPLLLISLTSCFWASRGTETSSVSDLFPVYVLPVGDSYFSSRTSQICQQEPLVWSQNLLFSAHTHFPHCSSVQGHDQRFVPECDDDDKNANEYHGTLTSDTNKT